MKGSPNREKFHYFLLVMINLAYPGGGWTTQDRCFIEPGIFLLTSFV
jgi:hypothetical protein